MKVIEKLKELAENNQINEINVKIDYRTYGNTYHYSVNGQNICNVKQTSKTINAIEDFAKENNIPIVEIGKKPDMWTDNWRSEIPFDPTEKAPSFKSRW